MVLFHWQKIMDQLNLEVLGIGEAVSFSTILIMHLLTFMSGT